MGVKRGCLMMLVREHADYKVSPRPILMFDLLKINPLQLQSTITPINLKGTIKCFSMQIFFTGCTVYFIFFRKKFFVLPFCPIW